MNTSLTGSLTILAGILLYTRTKNLNAKYLDLVSLGIVFQGILPVSFIPQGFLLDNQHQMIINVIAIIGALSTLIGLLLVTWSLKIHQQGKVPSRYYLMLIFFGISLSQVITGTNVMSINQEWIIDRGFLVRLLMFGGTGWVLYELVAVFFTGISNLEGVWGKISLLYPIGIVSSFLLLTFREQLPFPLTFYQIPTAIGSLLLTISIIKEPSLLVSAETELSLVVLADRRSGVAMLSYPKGSFDDSKTSLTAAAITGISNIIKEIAGKQDLPPNLGYADYMIGIFPRKDILVYTISTGDHPLMNAILRNLSMSWDTSMKISGGTVEKRLEKEFHDQVELNLEIFLHR